MKSTTFNGKTYEVLHVNMPSESMRKVLPQLSRQLHVKGTNGGLYLLQEFSDGRRRIYSTGRGIPKAVWEAPEYRKAAPEKDPDLMDRFIKWISE